MSTPHPLRRTNADYRWTKPKLLAFLQALARTGSVAQAARGVGMSRQSAYRLRARMGADFAAVWDEVGQQAYKGAAVTGFPNMLFVIGPNTGLGHSSMVFMIESQLNYLASALRTMRERGVATFEVRPEVQRAYNERLQRRMQRTIWQTGGCASWYLDKHGNNTTLWPSFTFVFRQITRRFDAEAYHLTAAETPVLQEGLSA